MVPPLDQFSPTYVLRASLEASNVSVEVACHTTTVPDSTHTEEQLHVQLYRVSKDMHRLQHGSMRQGTQGYLARNKQHPPPGPPYDPRCSPTVGSQEGGVSCEQGTPVPDRTHTEEQLRVQVYKGASPKRKCTPHRSLP